MVEQSGIEYLCLKNSFAGKSVWYQPQSCPLFRGPQAFTAQMTALGGLGSNGANGTLPT